MSRHRLRSIPARTVALVLGIAAASAAQAGDTHPALVSASLLPGWRAADGQHVAALEVRLEKGWKTYWRSPGEAGLPPVFDWQGSENLGALEVRWPRPEVFDLNGIRSIGYDQGVVLPLEIRPLDASAPIRLRGQIDLGVCEDICVPLSLSVDALLRPGAAIGPDVRITQALAAQPDPAVAHGLGDATCVLEAEGRGLRLTATLDLPPLGANETAVIEALGPDLWVSETITRREGARLIAMGEVYPTGRGPIVLERRDIVVTVLAGAEAVEVQGCPAP